MLQQILLPYVLAIILNEKNEVLLGYRKDTEWFADQYGLVGGKIDGTESATEAMVREISEEAGITVAPEDVKFAHIIHFLGEEGAPCVAFFFTIRTWQGDIHNAEKTKHDHLKWFALDKLPEKMIPRHKKAVELSTKGIFYSEDNWQKVAGKK